MVRTSAVSLPRPVWPGVTLAEWYADPGQFETLTPRSVDTSAWWDHQLALTLPGAGLQLGWSKIGDRVEFGWWEDRILEGMGQLP